MADSERKRLMDIIDEKASRGFTTYKEILTALKGTEIAKPSQDSGYGSLKRLLCSELKDKIESKQEGRTKSFRYKKGYEFYFTKKREEEIFKRLDGNDGKLFATKGLEMLMSQKQKKSEPLVELEYIEQDNIGLVNKLFTFLKKKNVIVFSYRKGYQQAIQVTLHPYQLKQYNSRWFLVGRLSDEGEKITIYALDRIIEGSITWRTDLRFRPAPPDFYTDYFKDIVGVSKPQGTKVEQLRLCTKDEKVHHLLETKPIHPSQKKVRDFNADQGGEFTIEVIPNIELQTRILSYGPGLYVPGEGAFQHRLKAAIDTMASYYR